LGCIRPRSKETENGPVSRDEEAPVWFIV
jgi:hypothetical protein